MSIQITTEQIKELRDSTGISVMQCKRALEEALGDMNKALAILKKNSSDIALKKGDREVKAGAITIKINGNKAVLVSLLCETDFVAKNEDFTTLLANLADMAMKEMSAQGGPASSWKEKAKEMIDLVIQKTGENIVLGEVFEVNGSTLGSYIHGGKTGIIVSLEGGNSELAKDIAMHITAIKPEYMSKEEIDPTAVKTITEVFEKEVASIDKPADIKKKMLEGKISTYFKEKTLVDQIFIKNDSTHPNDTVGQLLERSKAKIKEVKRYSI